MVLIEKIKLLQEESKSFKIYYDDEQDDLNWQLEFEFKGEMKYYEDNDIEGVLDLALDDIWAIY